MPLRCAVLALLLVCPAARGQENPESILQRAIALQRAGDTDGSIPQYRAYLKLRPEAVEARSNLGVALASTGRYGRPSLSIVKLSNAARRIRTSG